MGCRFTRQFKHDPEASVEAASADGRLLGTEPESGLPVTVRTGRFGPYLQLGDPPPPKPKVPKGEKKKKKTDAEKEAAAAEPVVKTKRSSIPKPYEPATITLEEALKLLALPRTVLPDWEGAPIVANLGRFGPYVAHNGTYANIESIEEVFNVGGNRAIELITAKREGRAGGRKFGQAAREVLKALGEHPAGGGKIEVLNGRYGPYINWGKVNANVPKGAKPEDVTLEQAVALLAEREAMAPSKKKPARGAAKAKPAAANDTGDEKPAAKKAAGKPAAKAKKAAPKPKPKAKPTEEAAE